MYKMAAPLFTTLVRKQFTFEVSPPVLQQIFLKIASLYISTVALEANANKCGQMMVALVVGKAYNTSEDTAWNAEVKNILKSRCIKYEYHCVVQIIDNVSHIDVPGINVRFYGALLSTGVKVYRIYQTVTGGYIVQVSNISTALEVIGDLIG